MNKYRIIQIKIWKEITYRIQVRYFLFFWEVIWNLSTEKDFLTIEECEKTIEKLLEEDSEKQTVIKNFKN